MKEGATLINCARAGIVDENAIREVKKSKKIRFLNDVYAKDADGEKSVSDIADIMLPHLGASTVEANTNAARKALNRSSNWMIQGPVTRSSIEHSFYNAIAAELTNALGGFCFSPSIRCYNSPLERRDAGRYERVVTRRAGSRAAR